MPSAGEDDLATRGSTVDPTRLARVRAIFEAALEQPAAMRAAFVAGACVGDPVLADDVRAMLAADATGEPLLDAAGHDAAGTVRLRATPLGATAGQEGPALHATPGSSPEEGRFPAGTVLAGRYRILGMLGRGGMGEVYRAHDLILNQTVALKFLNPGHLSEAALARFRNEVRIARQVSHPNVCRVYDLGMVEGLHFLSMEYIDGEDLASLLRRIGRLPQDKAIEFTRKICAGLGAAHERGVLHRDLKPANIMIDGRGQPRITDFGLAGLAAEIPLSDLRSGTPAYMSPEQKAGKDVTTRSDIYSLGLVLHEMFTGKRRAETQSHPSDLVKDLDPTIDRLILRCLDEDVKRRPASAFNVAMALPGADPIAAALAAGETPSPEMVAASQEKEGFTSRTAVLCYITLVIATIGSLFVNMNSHLLRVARLDVPVERLAFQAEDLLKTFGYGGRPAATAYGFECCDRKALEYANHHERSERDRLLASHQPPVVSFWYRQHRDTLFAEGRFSLEADFGSISYVLPANNEPGMARLRLDPTGRLLELEVRPEEDTGQEHVHAADVDWSPLLSATGLDPSHLSAVTPSGVPTMAFDARGAWTGTYGAGRTERVRVEAAAWHGRPVYLSVEADSLPDASRGLEVLIPVLVFLAVFTLIGAVLVAGHNLRSGKGDRKGAIRVAIVTMLLDAISALFSIRHVASLWEGQLLLSAAGKIAIMGLLVWTGYIAIEPFVRRHWPESLISWTRLQAGQLRDPLVMSHVLVGLTVWMLIEVLGAPFWSLTPLHTPESLVVVDRAAPFLAFLANRPSRLFTGTVMLVLLVVVLRLLVRRRLWLADSCACLLFALTGPPIDTTSTTGFIVSVAVGFAAIWSVLWLLRRFGYVALLAAWLGRCLTVPFVFDSWYSSRGFIVCGIIVAIGTWALAVILSERRQPSLESAA